MERRCERASKLAGDVMKASLQPGTIKSALKTDICAYNHDLSRFSRMMGSLWKLHVAAVYVEARRWADQKRILMLTSSKARYSYTSHTYLRLKTLC